VQADSLKAMLELKTVVPGIVYDLRYATPLNFTQKQLYKSGIYTYMRRPAARALASVQLELAGKGLGLKIFDAYRPYSITKMMWDLIKDERYVANPAKGSGHNRGLAVDLTLIDLTTGKELDMGTGFDNFSDTAHQDFINLKPEVLANRKLLHGLMEKAGFTVLPTEWWHYYWTNDRNYSVLDLEFKQLKKKCD
jgi:D-alanyl-D-alanine dipeptidase